MVWNKTAIKILNFIEKILKIFSLLVLCWILNPFGPKYWPSGHGLNNFQTTLSEDDCNDISEIVALWLLITRIQNILIRSLCLQFLISFSSGLFLPSLVKFCPVVLEKKPNMWKIYRQAGDKTDGGQQVIRSDLNSIPIVVVFSTSFSAIAETQSNYCIFINQLWWHFAER